MIVLLLGKSLDLKKTSSLSLLLVDLKVSDESEMSPNYKNYIFDNLAVVVGTGYWTLDNANEWLVLVVTNIVILLPEWKTAPGETQFKDVPAPRLFLTLKSERSERLTLNQ